MKVSFKIKGEIHSNYQQGVCSGVQMLNKFQLCEHNQHIQFTLLQLVIGPAQVILTEMCSYH